ncbi:MAG TPA: hypothetical protein PKK10_18910 [Woeseiaceae bacterium]|nr:hypothetical protein [Woeseiaceae bacterium]
MNGPLILYIPGLLPKPPEATHLAALKACLLAGVCKSDVAVADSIRAADGSFDLVAWTYDFYREYRDIAKDSAAISDVITQPTASNADMREASSLLRRLTLSLYRWGDRLPFLIPHLASEKMAVHLHDLARYTENRDGVADHVRDMLKLRLRAAAEMERPILLVAHSMGSVIALDSLWQLSQLENASVRVDTLLTMGSPLGQRYLRKRLLGHAETGSDRYPTNIRHWINLAAVGDLTAIDPSLSDDFAEMRDLQLLESIDDLSLYNYFRLNGQLNVHSEYGYLVNEVTGSVVADWWRRTTSTHEP